MPYLGGIDHQRGDKRYELFSCSIIPPVSEENENATGDGKSLLITISRSRWNGDPGCAWRNDDRVRADSSDTDVIVGYATGGGGPSVIRSGILCHDGSVQVIEYGLEVSRPLL